MTPVSLHRCLAFAAAVLLVAGCDSAQEDGQIQLRPGTTLRYANALSGPNGSSVQGERTERVVGADQSLGDLQGLTLTESVVTWSDAPGLTFGARVWYRPSKIRFEEVAYQFFGDAPATGGLRGVATADPTLPRLARLALARHRATRPAGDDPPDCSYNCAVTVRETPRILLEYPAETGRTWTHWIEDEYYSSTREVVGTEMITTPAGTFRCVVVRSRIFNGTVEDATVDWVDYLSDVGLVRRRLVYRYPATDGPEPGGLVFSTQDEELVAVEG